MSSDQARRDYIDREITRIAESDLTPEQREQEADTLCQRVRLMFPRQAEEDRAALVRAWRDLLVADYRARQPKDA